MIRASDQQRLDTSSVHFYNRDTSISYDPCKTLSPLHPEQDHEHHVYRTTMCDEKDTLVTVLRTDMIDKNIHTIVKFLKRFTAGYPHVFSLFLDCHFPIDPVLLSFKLTHVALSKLLHKHDWCIRMKTPDLFQSVFCPAKITAVYDIKRFIFKPAGKLLACSIPRSVSSPSSWPWHILSRFSIVSPCRVIVSIIVYLMISLKSINKFARQILSIWKNVKKRSWQYSTHRHKGSLSENI